MQRRLIAMVAITGAAGMGLAAPSDRPPGRPTRNAQACIAVAGIADTIVQDDRTIDFVMEQKGRPVLRNVLPQPCPLLGIERTPAFRSVGARLCPGDPVEVLQNGQPIPGPSCPLGRFVPLQ